MQPVYVFEELRLPIELLAAALLYLLPFAKRKPHFALRAVGGFVFFTLCSLLYFVIFGPDKESPRLVYLTAFWYALIGLFAAFYARLCFSISRSDALFFDIAAFLTQNIVYCIYHCFMARVLFPALRDLLPLYIFGAMLFSAAVYAPLYALFRKPLRAADGKLLDDTRYMFGALCGAFTAMMVVLLFYQGAFSMRVSVYDTLAWLSGVLICLLFLLIQYSMIRIALRSRETATLETMLRGSERYYELSKEHIAIINRKCHDLKHQLKALERASDADRMEYIREAQNSIDFYRHLIYTDNEALNTILAEKGLFCQEKGIDFGCAVDDVDLSFIRLPDLYALLGNAIDNAIEYVETQDDPTLRTISMRIERKALFIGIQVTNPYTGEPLSLDELPHTHKADAADHGFGMRSIRFLAEKYGGTMEYSTADRLFTLQILLPMR